MTAQPKPTAADVVAALGYLFGARADGWMAEHDAQVAAQAWDEGYMAEHAARDDNPYRAA